MLVFFLFLPPFLPFPLIFISRVQKRVSEDKYACTKFYFNFWRYVLGFRCEVSVFYCFFPFPLIFISWCKILREGIIMQISFIRYGVFFFFFFLKLFISCAKGNTVCAEEGRKRKVNTMKSIFCIFCGSSFFDFQHYYLFLW